MESHEVSIIEKLNRVLPPGLREGCAVGFVLGYYLVTIPRAKWEWPTVSVLAATGLSLFVHFFQQRRPKPKLDIFWDDLVRLSDLVGDRQSKDERSMTQQFGRRTLQNMGQRDIKVEVSRRTREWFFSFVKDDWRYTNFGKEHVEADAMFYISEVSRESMLGRWWSGQVYRVGYYTTPDGTRFEWFTASVIEFLKRHKVPKIETGKPGKPKPSASYPDVFA